METMPQRTGKARRVPSYCQRLRGRSHGRNAFQLQTSNTRIAHRVQTLRPNGCSFCAFATVPLRNASEALVRSGFYALHLNVRWERCATVALAGAIYPVQLRQRRSWSRTRSSCPKGQAPQAEKQVSAPETCHGRVAPPALPARCILSASGSLAAQSQPYAPLALVRRHHFALTRSESAGPGE